MNRTYRIGAASALLCTLGVAGVYAYGPLGATAVDSVAPANFQLPPVLAAPSTAGRGGPSTATPEIDTSYLWAAFEAGDFQAVRDELEVLRRLNPNWAPPADLIRLTDAMQSRGIVLPALAAGAYGDVTAFYETHYGWFACADITIEALWGVAEAKAALDDVEGAFAVYHRVLDECAATDLRLATLEKAIALQDRARFAALLAVEEEFAHDEVEAERLARIHRDGLGGPEGPVAPVVVSKFDRTLGAVGARRASSADVAWLERETLQRRNANAAMVIGYHHLDAADAATAVEWFDRSLGWRSTSKAIEGLYHAYGRLGDRTAQARLVATHPRILQRLADQGGRKSTQLARAWQALDEGDSEAALRWAEMTEPGVDVADRALVEGWALLNSDRPAEAEAAFAAAAASSNAKSRASARKGEALAMIANGRVRAIEVDPTLPAEDAADIERAKLEHEIAQLHRHGKPAEAYRLLQERERRFRGAAKLGALEGWILYDLRKLRAAERVFSDLLGSEHYEEAKKGLRAVRDKMYPNNS